MKRKSFHIRVVICTLAGLLSGLAFGAPETGNSEQEESARQLRIYRDSLLQGSTEEIRVDAAVGLLLRNDDASRDALVAVLSEADNPIAQQAVCKALIKSRGLGQTIRSRMIYLDPLMEILRIMLKGRFWRPRHCFYIVIGILKRLWRRSYRPRKRVIRLG
ncbi:MAG: hypothetical protein ACYTER_08630 [Planctomycetota bacterium]